MSQSENFYSTKKSQPSTIKQEFNGSWANLLENFANNLNNDSFTNQNLFDLNLKSKNIKLKLFF